VARLVAGESYVDDVPSEVLAETLANGSYRASAEAKSLGGFDVAVITVPTPVAGRRPGSVIHRDVGRTLARFLRPGATVVLESTTYPGTTEDLVAQVLEEGSGLKAGDDFHLGYSPELIDPCNETWTVVNTARRWTGSAPR
jgi:UDP-N-acetyl-D-glucosamine dehydrogenase